MGCFRNNEHRRLSIHVEEKNDLIPMPFSPLVRSILFFSNQYRLSSWKKEMDKVFWNLILLRVLDMEICRTYDEAFVEVQMPVHLRYFSFGTRVKSIPSSIANLQNLETLIVNGLGEIVVPVEIWKLTKLRHLRINTSARFIVDDNAPENYSKLETLSTLLVSRGEEKKLIGRIPNLRKLKCIWEKPWDVTQNSSMLEGLVFLDKLESLNVRFCGVLQFQHELNHLPLNLKKLTVSWCNLQWSQISSLQKLPNLEILKLLYNAVEDELWDMEVLPQITFPKLKFLKLTNLHIEQWSASSDNFPCLKQLVIEYCKQLEEIPSGLGDICSLEKIEVQRCRRSAAKSAKQIEEVQMDAGNDLLKVHIYPPYLESVTSSDSE